MKWLLIVEILVNSQWIAADRYLPGWSPRAYATHSECSIRQQQFMINIAGTAQSGLWRARCEAR